MALYNSKNVKQLPQLEEVVEGNYLIVENDFGTNIINFADFVVGPNNVSFYNVVTTLSSRSVSMSATVDTRFQTLSTALLSAANTRINALTANYPRFFVVYPNTLTVVNGLKSGQIQFNSELGDIFVSDINVNPTNDASSKMSWCLLLSSIQNPGNPPSPTPYTYTITISSSTAVSSNATFETKVLKFF
jgi:hypothetical protein